MIIPLKLETPLIRNPPLGEKEYWYCQFRRRHDYPPHKKLPPPSEANIVTINLDGGTINLDGGGGSY